MRIVYVAKFSSEALSIAEMKTPQIPGVLLTDVQAKSLFV